MRERVVFADVWGRAAQSDTPAAEEVHRSSTAESVKSFISGGAGGVAAVLVGAFTLLYKPGHLSEPVTQLGHPFDLTKTRLQTAAPGTYTGAIDVVKKTLARDGATGCVRLHAHSPRYA